MKPLFKELLILLEILLLAFGVSQAWKKTFNDPRRIQAEMKNECYCQKGSEK